MITEKKRENNCWQKSKRRRKFFFGGENVAMREKEQRRKMRIFLQKGEISGGRSRRMEKKHHKNEICNIFTSGGSILDDCPGMKKLQ